MNFIFGNRLLTLRFKMALVQKLLVLNKDDIIFRIAYFNNFIKIIIHLPDIKHHFAVKKAIT